MYVIRFLTGMTSLASGWNKRGREKHGGDPHGGFIPPVTQNWAGTSMKRCLTGKRDEARSELKANKSTLHTCICCVFSGADTAAHARTTRARDLANGGGGGLLLCPRPPTRYPEPCVALCASFELSNIQVRTGKYIYLPRVRAQRWWMTWPVELWWPGDRAPLINRLQGFTPLCVINKRCSSLLFPCHR